MRTLVNHFIFKVLSLRDKEEWNKLLNKFDDFFQDVYFYPEYYELYENSYIDVQCFIFCDKEKTLLYPCLKTNINEALKTDFASFDLIWDVFSRGA